MIAETLETTPRRGAEDCADPQFLKKVPDIVGLYVLSWRTTELAAATCATECWVSSLCKRP
jgi:hypothetical protein